MNEPLRFYYRDAANSIVNQQLEHGALQRLAQATPARYFFKNCHLNTNAVKGRQT